MCYLIVERYSVCQCLYYKHSVDICAKYESGGHYMAERTVLVGYACDKHSAHELESQVPKGMYEIALAWSRLLTITVDAGQKAPRNRSDPPKPRRKEKRPPRTLSTGNLSAQQESKFKPKTRNEILNILPLEREIEGLDLVLLDGNDSDSDSSIAPSQIWSEPEKPAASTSTAPALNVASAELVSLLVEHPSLKDLYRRAITNHGPAEFRESLCLVLKSYAKALKSGAKNPQEYKAGELVRSYARRVAHACVAFYDPNIPGPDVIFRWTALRRQKIQAATREEQLLSRRRSSEPDTIVSGWGIHIDETLNEEALAILVLVILLFSALVGIVYSIRTGDVSSGFTIAGYIATVLGVVITVLYFRWQHG